MKRSKNNIIFYTNSLLLSAFEEDNKISPVIRKENDILKSTVDKELSETNILELFKDTSEYKYSFNNQVQIFSLLVNSLKNNPKDIKIIKNISKILISLKAFDTVIKHFEKDLLSQESNDSEITEILANAYFGVYEYYPNAIKMYEKLINKYKIEKSVYYYKLSFLYERIYQDKQLDKQIEYALKASELSPNNNQINITLAKLYYRKGLKDKCKEYSDIVMNNNPTPEQRIIYCRFLMQDGQLTKSYDIYRCRFKTNNVAYPDLLTDDKRWDGKKDLSDSTVIIHYEQGFGDSIMFSRYIPEIAKKAKKVILVIQKNIIPILESSGFNKYCEILSHEADINQNIKLDNVNSSVMYSAGSGMGKIPHDYHIPMIDLPYLVGENPDRMKEAGGYLIADKNRIDEFKNKYIVNKDRLKIGIAYRGSKESESTYRDISIKEFLPLLELDNTDLYLFQADIRQDELKNIDSSRIYNITDYFKDFGDTAAALSSMDLIISTDNVIMNLAGALAVKTYGLFNIYPESRWYKTDGNDIGWYKSVRPFKVDTFNDWDNLIENVKKQLKKDFKHFF